MYAMAELSKLDNGDLVSFDWYFVAGNWFSSFLTGCFVVGNWFKFLFGFKTACILY